MDGYSEPEEYGNSKIWRQKAVFIKYEAEIPSRVSSGFWQVAYRDQ